MEQQLSKDKKRKEYLAQHWTGVRGKNGLHSLGRGGLHTWRCCRRLAWPLNSHSKFNVISSYAHLVALGKVLWMCKMLLRSSSAFCLRWFSASDGQNC